MLYSQIYSRRCLTVCNFFSISTTKQNCKNNDFQTGFLNTSPILHWSDKQEVPPQNLRANVVKSGCLKNVLKVTVFSLFGRINL